MEKLSLPALAAEFQSMVERLDAEPYCDGSPHVEMRSGQFEFVVTERGSELQRISGFHSDDVLYLLFKGITLSMATSYELRHRKPSGDSRAVWFPYQEEWMARLKPS